MKKPSLSLVIPAYNEEQSLAYVLSDTLKYLPKIVWRSEVIVVDDGSTDQTGEIAETFAKKSRRLRVIHQRHGGFNKALLAGIKAARKDYVAYMQADGQDLVRDLVNCFRVMDQYDLVLGKRGKRIDYDLYRLFLSYGGLIAYRLLFSIQYEDVHWVYVWRVSQIQKLRLDPKGGMFLLVESLIKFRKKGLKIGEATAPYRPRYAGVSKNSNPQVIWRTLVSMFKLWRRQRG